MILKILMQTNVMIMSIMNFEDNKMAEKRFVKYDGNTIVDLKLVKSWIISNGNVDLLLEILNNEKTSKKESV